MGMFLILRVGPIYGIPGIMDQFEYIKILKEEMGVWLKHLFNNDIYPHFKFLLSNERLHFCLRFVIFDHIFQGCQYLPVTIHTYI